MYSYNKTLLMVVGSLMATFLGATALYLLYQNLKRICHKLSKLAVPLVENEIKTFALTGATSADPDACWSFNFGELDGSEEQIWKEDISSVEDETKLSNDTELDKFSIYNVE